MISGTPTTLQRIAASMLVQKTRLSRSPCCKPICTPRKCDRTVCIFAAARFWQEFTRTTIVLCTSILSAIQSVTVRLVKESCLTKTIGFWLSFASYVLGRGANAFIANDVRANVTQQSEGRKLCFQQALFLTSRHYAVGVSKIIPYSYINICFKFYHTLYINSTFKTNEKNIKYDSIFGNVSRETFFLCFTWNITF